jgi:hypothetical protein
LHQHWSDGDDQPFDELPIPTKHGWVMRGVWPSRARQSER